MTAIADRIIAEWEENAVVLRRVAQSPLVSFSEAVRLTALADRFDERVVQHRQKEKS